METTGFPKTKIARHFSSLMRPESAIHKLRKPSRRNRLKARISRVLHHKRASAPSATEPENYNLPEISDGSLHDEDNSGEVSDPDFVPSDENASAHNTQLDSEQPSLLDHLIEE
jgi:hypothetical protein